MWIEFARETVHSKLNPYEHQMRHCIHNHPVLVQWNSSRWPDETSDSLGIYSYTICNLQKAERGGQNQYRPAMRKACRELEQTPCGKRDHTAPMRDTCQPGHSSRKPAATQGCARVFTCIGQKKLGRLCFRLSPMALDTRQEGWCLWMSPGCSNPPGDSHKTDRKHGVRGITAQLREGNASHSSGCTTWCNQLYPKHGERDAQSPSPRRAGSHPPGASVRKDVQAAPGVTGQEHSISCWIDGSRINEHTLNSQRR